ncbi:MAG: radical SAM protein [Thermodesulfobacteriota bacterium]|nr:radical SAM protein [Thermodesulfobacteriota bacterium]
MTDSPERITECWARLNEHLESLGLEPASSYVNEAVFDGHLRIYPTLRCNLRCPYCVNEQMGATFKKYQLAPPEKWAEAINREKRHVVFTGGEPFLYPNLDRLANFIDPELRVRIYTNLCLGVLETLRKIKRRVHFFVSWHPRKGAEKDTFLANLNYILDAPHMTADIHVIDAEETRELLAEDLKYFRSKGIDPNVDSDQRTFEGSGRAEPVTAYCRRRIYLIAPDGTRYQCVSRLMRRVRPMENFFETPLGPEANVDICGEFGNCAPCDSLGETAMAIIKKQD